MKTTAALYSAIQKIRTNYQDYRCRHKEGFGVLSAASRRTRQADTQIRRTRAWQAHKTGGHTRLGAQEHNGTWLTLFLPVGWSHIVPN